MDCEMSAVHGLLSKIPETLSYEQVIVMAQELFEKHSPRRLARNEGLKLRNRCNTYYIKCAVRVYMCKCYYAHRLMFPSASSSLISTYDHFSRHIKYQHPDHLLSKGILPPTPPRWWLDWLPTPSFSLALRLLAFMTPVVLAVVLYWVRYHYGSMDSLFTSRRSIPI